MAKKNIVKGNKNTKQIVLLVISAIVVFALLVTGISFISSAVSKKKKDKTVRVAFYGIDEQYYEVLKEKIPQEEGITLVCDVLSDGNLDLASVKEKYDMLFTWKGEVTDVLQDSSEEIPSRILETMPTSLRNKKCVPILLDHCEFAYSKDILTKTGNEIPSNFAGLLNYLNESKNYAFTPFFCLGGDDRVLTAFVGALVEALGGLEAYNKLIEEMRKDLSFEELLDLSLNASGLTLKKVLDELKSWPKEGYTHPAWYNGSGNDLMYFAKDDHIAVFFTFLRDHREIPYEVISKFEAFPLPMMSSTSSFGLIAPALSVMLLSENDNAKRYLYEFFTEEVQMELSDRTRLAPVHSRAQAYDRQADDVRYWAASCPGGALPDLYLAVFQRYPEKLSAFATQCRAYIR